ARQRGARLIGGCAGQPAGGRDHGLLRARFQGQAQPPPQPDDPFGRLPGLSASVTRPGRPGRSQAGRRGNGRHHARPPPPAPPPPPPPPAPPPPRRSWLRSKARAPAPAALMIPNGTAAEQLCTTVYFPVLAITCANRSLSTSASTGRSRDSPLAVGTSPPATADRAGSSNWTISWAPGIRLAISAT